MKKLMQRSQEFTGRPVHHSVLSVKDVVYSVREPNGTLKTILDKLSFTVRPSELMIIAGPSGCGKTTLLTLLSGTRPMQEGSITVEGLELQNATPELLRQARSKIGIVFQSHRLLPFLSVGQNVLAGIEAHRNLSRERKDIIVHEMLSAVGLEHHIDHTPRQLSGGQLQRAGLARALANNPRVLVADEPTASLDTKTATSMMQLIRTISLEKSMAVVMSTHDHRVIDQGDQILRL